MSNRNAASLTGSLLVRKGAAAPSPLRRESGSDAPSRSRFKPKLAPSPVTLRAANDKLARSAKGAAKGNGKPRRSRTKTAAEPAREGASDVRRFTLRLSPDQHLKLRLASVHLGRSGQKLVLEAVNEYLERIAPELRDGNCACILDGVEAPPRAKGRPAK